MVTSDKTPCGLCRTPSTREDLLGWAWDWSAFSSKRICRACVLKRSNAHRYQRWAYRGFLMMATLWYVVDYDEAAMQWRLADLAILSAFSFLFIVVHLLLQVAVGKLFGLQVRQAIIGSGPTLRQFDLLGLTWEIKPFPFSSAILMTTSHRRWHRLRNFLAIATGPIFNAALLVLLAERLTLPSLEEIQMGHGVALAFDILMADVIVLVMSTWPRRIRSIIKALPSDGLRLLRLLLLGKEKLRQEIAYGYAYDAWDLVVEDDLEGAKRVYEEGLRLAPGNPTLLVGYAGVTAELGATDTARKILRELLVTPGLDWWVKALALNKLAYYDVLSERPELLSEADDCSSEAYWSYPWYPYFIGTRGAVMARKGMLEEAEALLRQAIKFHHDKQAKSDLYCHLGYIELRRGDDQKAQEHFEQARSLFPRNRLLKQLSTPAYVS